MSRRFEGVASSSGEGILKSSVFEPPIYTLSSDPASFGIFFGFLLNFFSAFCFSPILPDFLALIFPFSSFSLHFQSFPLSPLDFSLFIILFFPSLDLCPLPFLLAYIYLFLFQFLGSINADLAFYKLSTLLGEDSTLLGE